MCRWEPALFGWSMLKAFVWLSHCKFPGSIITVPVLQQVISTSSMKRGKGHRLCSDMFGHFASTARTRGPVFWYPASSGCRLFCTARDALLCIEMGRSYNQWQTSHAENWEPQQRSVPKGFDQALESIHAMVSFRRLGNSLECEGTVDLGCNKAVAFWTTLFFRRVQESKLPPGSVCTVEPFMVNTIYTYSVHGASWVWQRWQNLKMIPDTNRIQSHFWDVLGSELWLVNQPAPVTYPPRNKAL